MTPERLRLRAALGLGLVLGALGLLSLRLVWLQVFVAGEARASARAQHYTRVEVVKARRGRILDRNGQTLAVTQPFPSVAVDPKKVNDAAQFAVAVERALGVSAARVRTEIAKGGRFRWLARQVADRASVEALERHLRASKIDGLVVVEEPKRIYPLGAVGAHVLGFTDRDGKGLEGIEALKDRELAGRDGRRVTLRDASGTPILSPGTPFDPPTDGDDVRLTIDATIQAIAEDEANRTWVESKALGVAVGVVDLTTGELLAVASRPTFDPNDATRTTPDQRRNRFFTDSFEPGSVFKPIVLASALDAGVITPATRIDTDGGVFRMKGRVIHEDRNHDYGVVTLTDVVAHSSNVAMAKIGLLLGTPRMKSALALHGFGARTSVRWPGEQAGDVQAQRKWRDSDQLVSSAFGHAITATPAQLLQGYATLGAGGLRRELRIFADAPLTEPVRVVSETSAAALVPMMEAVLLEGGTAAHARKNCAEFPVAGKTGTAQKLQTGGNVSSFACFGPTNAPRLAVLVLVDEPKKASYGSVVAAPYALRILRQSLHYLTVEPPAVAALRRPGTLTSSEVAPR